MNATRRAPSPLQDALDVFASLSDTTRLRIVRVLITSGLEMCVCEIMDSIGETQNNVSRHLKVLRHAGLVVEGKRGKWVPYSVIQPPAGSFVTAILQAIQFLPDDLFAADLRRMRARLSLRRSNECIIGMNSDLWRKVCAKLQK